MGAAALAIHQEVLQGPLHQLTVEQQAEQLDQQVQERLDTIIQQTAKAQGITEALKAADPMAWVGRMNNIQTVVKEIVNTEIIYA